MDGFRRPRHRWARAAGGALTAVCLILSVACSSSTTPTPAEYLAGLRSAINNQVADGGRSEDMLTKVDEMETILEEFGEVVGRHQDLIAELYRNYDATRSEVLEALDRYQGERRELVDRMVAVHYEFKDLASDDEWPKLAKAERKALTAMATTILGTAPAPLQEG